MFIINLVLYNFLMLLIDYSAADVYVIKPGSPFYFDDFEDEEATFGPGFIPAIRGHLVYSYPMNGCSKLPPANASVNELPWIIMVPRNNCSFDTKIRFAQDAGYGAVIVHNINSDQLVPMSGTNTSGIIIPSVFVGAKTGRALQGFCSLDFDIIITANTPFNFQSHLLIPFAIVVGICFLCMMVFMIIKFIKDRRRLNRHRLPTSTLNKLPTHKYQNSDVYETCVICLDDYVEGEKLRILPCNHAYHTKCIDPWLTKNKRVCPICKRKVFVQDEPLPSDSDSDTDDRTPLIRDSNRGTQGGTFQGGTLTADQHENPFSRVIRSISQQSGATAFVTTSDHHSINGEYGPNPFDTSSDEDYSTQDHHHNPNDLDHSAVEVQVNTTSANDENEYVV